MWLYRDVHVLYTFSKSMGVSNSNLDSINARGWHKNIKALPPRRRIASFLQLFSDCTVIPDVPPWTLRHPKIC